MQSLLNRAVPVLSLLLIASMVFAQEAQTAMGLNVMIASLPIIIGVLLVVCLYQFNED